MSWAMEEARVRRASVLALGVWPWPHLDIDNEASIAGWTSGYIDIRMCRSKLLRPA